MITTDTNVTVLGNIGDMALIKATAVVEKLAATYTVVIYKRDTVKYIYRVNKYY